MAYDCIEGGDKLAGIKWEPKVILPSPSIHPPQLAFINSKAKRKVIRAGRRGGKTVGAAIIAVMAFTEGKRVLYAAPTGEQTGKFWFEVSKALLPLTDPEPINYNGKMIPAPKIFRKSEDEKFIERIGTEQRIKAKTAWNADTLRGDYADVLILDEYQLMNEDAWEVVGMPMLLDKDGEAIFIYTPPSRRTAGASKAHDPMHAAKLFKKAQEDTTGRWKTFHFTTFDNPIINKTALAELTSEMSRDVFHKEIMAEDDDLETGWLVYGAFNEERRKIDHFDVPLSWPIYTFHDFGGANPAALLMAKAQLPLPQNCSAGMRQGDLVIFKEYLPGAGKSNVQHVNAFKQLTKDRLVAARVGGSHQETEIRQGYAALGWPIVEPKTKGVKVQVDKVIQLFEDDRIWVFKNLVNLNQELQTCIWKPLPDGTKSDEIKDEARFHLLACLRYGCSLPDFVPSAMINRSLKPIQSLHFLNTARIPVWARR